MAGGIEKLGPEDIEFLSGILAEHIALTGSTTTARPQDLVKIVPPPYRHVLDIIDVAERDGRNPNEAIMEAVK